MFVVDVLHILFFWAFIANGFCRGHVFSVHNAGQLGLLKLRAIKRSGAWIISDYGLTPVSLAAIIYFRFFHCRPQYIC